MAGPEQVLGYLARYTHRIAISNDRIVSMRGDEVTFRFRDRADGNAVKLATLPAVDFMRRFLQHVLPAGFPPSPSGLRWTGVRVRAYGMLSNRTRRDRLARCRRLLGASPPAPPAFAEASADKPVPSPWPELLLPPSRCALRWTSRLTGRDVTRCPSCRDGRMVLLESIRPAATPSRRWAQPGRATSP